MTAPVILWDFDGTLAHRPGMWSQCCADVLNEMKDAAIFDRSAFAPLLSSGFPWHTPEAAHTHLSGSPSA